MRVQYVCKYCQHLVGELNEPGWSLEDAKRLCGFYQLTAVERTESIDYNGGDGSIYVKTVCDYCQDAVETHPELLVEGKLLQ